MLSTPDSNQAMIGLAYASERRVSRPMIAASKILIRMSDRIGVWLDRSEERRRLRALDDRMLADIASDRSLALREAEKWFWER